MPSGVFHALTSKPCAATVCNPAILMCVTDRARALAADPIDWVLASDTIYFDGVR